MFSLELLCWVFEAFFLVKEFYFVSGIDDFLCVEVFRSSVFALSFYSSVILCE